MWDMVISSGQMRSLQAIYEATEAIATDCLSPCSKGETLLTSLMLGIVAFCSATH